MFEVRRLRLLRELATHKPIAATAEACSLTPSAVSQQLALLEHEARTPLLVRDERRVMLTQAARVLVDHTERVLYELERAHAAIGALSTSVCGTVRLSSFPSAAVALAAPAIAACRAAHPDLRVLLDEAEPHRSIGALRTHYSDVALVYEYNLLPHSATRASRVNRSSRSRCSSPFHRMRTRCPRTGPSTSPIWTRRGGSPRTATLRCGPCSSARARRSASHHGSTTPATTTP